MSIRNANLAIFCILLSLAGISHGAEDKASERKGKLALFKQAVESIRKDLSAEINDEALERKLFERVEVLATLMENNAMVYSLDEPVPKEKTLMEISRKLGSDPALPRGYRQEHLPDLATVLYMFAGNIHTGPLELHHLRSLVSNLLTTSMTVPGSAAQLSKTIHSFAPEYRRVVPIVFAFCFKYIHYPLDLGDGVIELSDAVRDWKKTLIPGVVELPDVELVERAVPEKYSQMQEIMWAFMERRLKHKLALFHQGQSWAGDLSPGEFERKNQQISELCRLVPLDFAADVVLPTLDKKGVRTINREGVDRVGAARARLIGKLKTLDSRPYHAEIRRMAAESAKARDRLQEFYWELFHESKSAPWEIKTEEFDRLFAAWSIKKSKEDKAKPQAQAQHSFKAKKKKKAKGKAKEAAEDLGEETKQTASRQRAQIAAPSAKASSSHQYLMPKDFMYLSDGKKFREIFSAQDRVLRWHITREVVESVRGFRDKNAEGAWEKRYEHRSDEDILVQQIDHLPFELKRIAHLSDGRGKRYYFPYQFEKDERMHRGISFLVGVFVDGVEVKRGFVHISYGLEAKRDSVYHAQFVKGDTAGLIASLGKTAPAEASNLEDTDAGSWENVGVVSFLPGPDGQIRMRLTAFPRLEYVAYPAINR